jgi:hypothetical protein
MSLHLSHFMFFISYSSLANGKETIANSPLLFKAADND